MATVQQPGEDALTFDGKKFAVLNLDLMTILIDSVKDTTEERTFIPNCSRWNRAVHQKNPRPLTIFTSLLFNPREPELVRGAPFTKLLRALALLGLALLESR